MGLKQVAHFSNTRPKSTQAVTMKYSLRSLRRIAVPVILAGFLAIPLILFVILEWLWFYWMFAP